MFGSKYGEISGKEFEFLVIALSRKLFDATDMDQACVMNALTEHLANVSFTDVISAETVGTMYSEVKRICDFTNQAANDLCVGLCRTISRMSREEVSLLVAVVMGCNLQRYANCFDTSLERAWGDEISLPGSIFDASIGDTSQETPIEVPQNTSNRGIIIDPFTKEIREAHVAPGIENLYDVLGCQLVTGGAPIHGHYMYVNDDERGAFSDPFFAYEGYAFSGRAVILGLGPMGDSTPCTLSVEEVKSKIAWPSLMQVLLSSPL